MSEILNYDQQQAPTKTAMVEGVISRQAQEVQAAMVIAKRFPRDENYAYSKIMQSCKRKTLAEQAEYEYKRGSEKVNGPSIRLAESLARNWGNMDYGIIELEQKKGKSEMMAYAWDLETNTRVTRVFTVRHWRDTRKGGYALKNARDIYELTANYGARRVRACILEVIPGDVVDAAIEECRNTLQGAYKEPLTDRVRKMIASFESDFQVTKDMLEKYIGHNADAFSDNDFLRLKKIYKALRDGMSTREELFDISKSKPSNEQSPLNKENADKKKNNAE